MGDGDSLTLGKAKIDLYRCLFFGEKPAIVGAQGIFRNSSPFPQRNISGSVQRFFLDALPGGFEGRFDQAAPSRHQHHRAERRGFPLAAVAPPTGQKACGRLQAWPSLTAGKLPTLFSGDATVYAVTNGEDCVYTRFPGSYNPWPGFVANPTALFWSALCCCPYMALNIFLTRMRRKQKPSP